MRTYVFTAFIALVAGNVIAQQPASPPAAPQVTVGADLKQLIFDWNAVPGAQSYQLYYKSNAGAAFAPVGSPILPPQTRARVNISVHLQNWPQSRYKVAACNAAGCQDSAALSVANQMLDTIGYFKASNTETGDQFGRAVAVSSDGRTLVVAAVNEDSAATGVNGNQADNTAQNAGAVYVFRRNGSGWHQEAYLKGAPSGVDQYFGGTWPIDYRAVSVSADGGIVAIGAPGEMLNGTQYVGAVYLYGRASNGSWSLLQKLRAPAPISYDFFGEGLNLSGDGNTLRAMGFGGRDGEGNPQGEHHIFVRSGGTWTFQTTLTIPHNEVDFCSSGQMSGDATTVVQYCYSFSTEGNRVVTWKRAGATWTKLPTFLKVNNTRTEEVAISYGAQRLAFRDSSHPLSSNVRVFRWENSAWVEEAVIETPAGFDSGYSTWGSSLSFDRNGNLLALGDYFGLAGGRGVSDTMQLGGANAPVGGAVFIYGRTTNATNRWVFRKQVKAPNAEEGDGFGVYTAFCGTGSTLAVSAVWESSAAKGVDGNQLDNSATQAGAVYLY